MKPRRGSSNESPRTNWRSYIFMRAKLESKKFERERRQIVCPLRYLLTAISKGRIKTRGGPGRMAPSLKNRTGNQIQAVLTYTELSTLLFRRPSSSGGR